MLGRSYPLVCGPGSRPGTAARRDVACEEHARGSCSSADVSNIRFVIDLCSPWSQEKASCKKAVRKVRQKT